MTREGLVRAVALVMLAVATVDPGCAVARRPAVRLVVGSDVAPDVADRLHLLIGSAYPEQGRDADGPETIRIGAGRPRELIAAHRQRPLTLAVRLAAPALHISDLVPPRLVVSGVSSVVRVRVTGHAIAAGGRVGVAVRDERTGQRAGQGQGVIDENGTAWVEVPLLPITSGRWPVCAEARLDADTATSPRVCIDLQVLPRDVRVDVFEARPSWAARFARLALTRWDGATVVSRVRVAPPISVTTRSSGGELAEAGEADVLLVGGLDALTSADVTRLTGEVRDHGRTVVLLADGPVDATHMQSLWPYALRSAATVPTPLALMIGPHAWRAREWLAPPIGATDVETLAYLDASPPAPGVLARALGTGRVVLVSALDTWRWRRAEGVAFDAAWQTLVLSLAADGALARRPVVWRLAGPLADEVHVARTMGGVAPARDVAAPLRFERDSVHTAAWVSTGASGDERATLALASSADVERLVVPGGLGRRLPDVIEVGSTRDLPAAWDDVERLVAGDGGQVIDEPDLARTLRLLDVSPVAGGPRWFVTRQWWFAAFVIVALGLEWWWRRLARRR